MELKSSVVYHFSIRDVQVFVMNISLCILAFLSFLAFKEYLSLIPTRRTDHRVLFWAYLTIPIQYYLIAKGWYGAFIVFIPVYAFLFLTLRMVLIGETEGFLRSIGLLQWGLMTTVFSIGHVAYLLVLPKAGNPHGGGFALLLYLVFLTQINDVSQYWWGKALGRRQISPKVNRNKTWEGLLGGVCTTTLLAVILAPFLTPLGRWAAVGAGLIIGLGGFTGDITLSAVKRDLGIKNTSAMLPGRGGILDRIDSLTYAAPLFFHYLHYLYY